MRQASVWSLPALLAITAVWSTIVWSTIPASVQAGSPPPDFVESTVAGGWNQIVGVTFDSNGGMYAWERAGRIWTVYNNTRSSTPLLDISDEVGAWRDHGCLGLALHPSFHSNGYIYLLYVVDHHHLVHAGTPAYDPTADEYLMASIGRVTRYTVDLTSTDSNGVLTAIVPGSRLVLLGESASTGIPILHESHGVGQLLFATDGTLLVSCGDGASYVYPDTGGGGAGAYASQALAEGIITPKEDIGALRAQLVDSLSGKILRLDPMTGDGLPSNPFFDATAPRAPRSRVWGLGFRNPFRFSLCPGTGSHVPADGDPGVLVVADVGWADEEDLHLLRGAGSSCGWPLFEGMEPLWAYFHSTVPNQDAPNPLQGTGSCTRAFLHFSELLIQDTANPAPSFPIDCGGQIGSVPASYPRFLHSRPIVTYSHASERVRVPTYSGLTATYAELGTPGSPVAGDPFRGYSVTANAWYDASSFPTTYNGTVFVADFVNGWIRNLVFDANHNLTEVRPFLTGGGDVAHLVIDPNDGSLIYIDYPYTVRRVSYTPSGNQPPTAVATQSDSFGATPLTVHFTGSGSVDPEGQPLTYHWDFGNGVSSTLPDPTHTFVAAPGVPTPFDVTLTVTDSDGATSTATLTVSVENTPPQLTVLSPIDGSFYPLTHDSVYDLDAQVVDAEHGPADIVCTKQVILYHNTHSHDEPIVVGCGIDQAVISPVGCSGETYYYGVRFSATDAAGLTTTEEVFLYPACTNQPPGLEGTYFDEPDLTQPVLTRSDPVLSFNWGAGAPDPQMHPDTFSVLWLGEIEPLYSEVYELSLTSDDGCRLWIDSVLVIDAWFDQAATAHTGSISLVAGQRHELRVEYYENTLDAVCELRWSSPSQPLEIVPASALFPPSPPPPPPPPAPPVLTILSPQPGEVVTTTTLAVDYSFTGRGFDHLHITIDQPPHMTVHQLDGSYLLPPLVPGSHTLTLQLVDSHHTPLPHPEATASVTFDVTPQAFVRGDTNHDQNVDLVDAIVILFYLFGTGGPQVLCLDALDVGDNGTVDLSDAVILLDHILTGAPAPPAPYPLPGLDPTADALDCAVSP